MSQFRRFANLYATGGVIPAMKRANVGVRLLVLSFVGFAALAGFLVMSPAPKSYSFVSVNHPVDMWGSGHDKWAYYAIGKGSTASLAALVRKSLEPQGYVEDNSVRPWYRFVKGDIEVVVCNHDEFAVNRSPFGSTLVKQDPKQTLARLRPSAPKSMTPSTKFPCLLVKNGPGTSESLVGFRLKKLVHGW